MPTNLTQFTEKLNAFNQKYNADFSIDAFTQTVEEDNWDYAYWQAYSTLASSLADKKMEGESFPSLHQMLYDYEEMFVPYRLHRAESGQKAPSAYGGKPTPKEQSEMVKNAIGNRAIYQYQFIAQKYMQGEIRIRDMVMFAENSSDQAINQRFADIEGAAGVLKLAEVLSPVNKNADPEPQQEHFLGSEAAVEILKFSLALKLANEQRSTLWRIFHPFRNAAEQRDAEYLNQLVSTQFPDDYESLLMKASTEANVNFSADADIITFQENAILNENIDSYDFEAEKRENPLLDDDLTEEIDLPSEKEFIDALENDDLLFDEAQLEDNGNIIAENKTNDFLAEDEIDFKPQTLESKTKVKKDSSPAKQDSKQSEVKKQERPAEPLARIGYRPTPDTFTLRKEGNKIKSMLDRLRKGPNASQAELTVLEANFQRYVDVYFKITSYGLDHAKTFIKNNEEKYAQEDAALRERFPSYDPLPKEDVKLADDAERVNIIIDMDDKKSEDLSKPIDNNDVNIGAQSFKK